MEKDAYGFPDISIEGELLPFARPLVHTAFRSHLSQACRKLFENPEIFTDAKFKLEAIETGVLLGLELADDVIKILRKGATSPALRDIDRTHLAKATDPLIGGLSRLLDPFTSRIIPFELARRHVEPRRFKEISAGPVSSVDFINRLAAEERQNCISDLKLEKIGDLRMAGENLVDAIALIWMKALHTLICRQAIIVAVPRGPYVQLKDWMETVNQFEKSFRAKFFRPENGEDQEKSSGNQEHGEAGPVRGALPGLLVVPPMAWGKFTTNWAEHFGSSDALDASLQGPNGEDWQWLLEDAHYLIAFPTSAPITGAGSTVQHHLRRLLTVAQ